MLTIIRDKELQMIIRWSGEAIRDFLAHADAGKYRGEAHMAITSYQANPADFTDEKLLEYGKDTFKAIDHPARIEVRGQTREGAGQMVAKGIWGSKRSHAMAEIDKKCKEGGLQLLLKLAGTSSMEFNVAGVDKSVPIYFLQSCFDEVLKEMHYKPGPLIDSQKSKTVIAADGDGTIYDGPRVGRLPALADSPVKDVLCRYLQAGGVFMLISGNDINRTIKRLVEALPPETYGRVLVAANGGAELVHLNAQGHAVPISNYKKHALDLAHDRSKHHALDLVYIGDDGSKDGNDYPAFKAVGFKNSVLVAKEFLGDYDPGLVPAYVGGLLQGTRQYLEKYLERHHHKSL